MKLPTVRWCAGLLLALLLASCSTTTRVDAVGPATAAAAASAPDCAIEFLDKPPIAADATQVLGKVESHIKRNVFFGGKVSLQGDAYAELRGKACQLGGNLVVIDDFVESSAAEMSHLHVWATVMRSPR